MLQEIMLLVVISFLLIFIAYREIMAFVERKELLNRIMAKSYESFAEEDLRRLRAKNPPKKEVIDGIEI